MSGSFWQKKGNKIITFDVQPVKRYQVETAGRRSVESPRTRTAYYDRDSPVRERQDEEFILVPKKVRPPPPEP